MKNLPEWVNMFSQGGAVQRFHTVQTIGGENVAEHSFGVAMMCVALSKDGLPSGGLLRAALFHDLAEQATGDIPAPTKWKHPFLKTCIDGIEYGFDQEHKLSVVLTDQDQNTLKWADMLHLLLFCRNQRMLGNRHVNAMFERGVQYLNNMPHHEKGHEVLAWLVQTYGE